MEIQLIFQYLFLQSLPQTLRTQLGEQECSGASSGILSHAEQAWVGSSLCFKHFCYGAKANGCTKNQPCNWSGN